MQCLIWALFPRGPLDLHLICESIFERINNLIKFNLKFWRWPGKLTSFPTPKSRRWLLLTDPVLRCQYERQWFMWLWESLRQSQNYHFSVLICIGLPGFEIDRRLGRRQVTDFRRKPGTYLTHEIAIQRGRSGTPVGLLPATFGTRKWSWGGHAPLKNEGTCSVVQDQV